MLDPLLEVFGQDAVFGFTGGMLITILLAQWVKKSLMKGQPHWAKRVMVMIVALVISIAWDLRGDGSVDWKTLLSVFFVYLTSAVTLYHWVVEPILITLRKRLGISNINNSPDEEQGE